MQGMPFTRAAATAGDHIDCTMTSPAAINCTDWSNVVQVARKWPLFFNSIRRLLVNSISHFVMFPLLPYLISPALSKHNGASLIPIAGTSRIAALPFYSQLLSSFHSVVGFLITSGPQPIESAL